NGRFDLHGLPLGQAVGAERGEVAVVLLLGASAVEAALHHEVRPGRPTSHWLADSGAKFVGRAGGMAAAGERPPPEFVRTAGGLTEDSDQAGEAGERGRTESDSAANAARAHRRITSTLNAAFSGMGAD